MIGGFHLDAGFLVFRVHADCGRDVERAGEVVHHRVEKVLHTLVFEGRSTGHWDELVGDGRAADALLEVLESDRFLHQEFFADRFIDIGNGIEQLVVGLVGDFLLLGIEFLDGVGRAKLVVVGEIDRLAVDDIDLALEVFLGTDRDENAHGIGAEFFLHFAEHAVEVSTGAVHLVNEHDARHMVLGRLAPDGFGLRLDTGDAAEHDDRAIEYAQRALHLGGEVHVAGGVDDVDALLLLGEKLEGPLLHALPPFGGDGGGCDGDAALALLFHPVGRGRTVVHLADLVDHAGVEKNPLGEGRLARVDVRRNPDITGAFEHMLAFWTVRIHEGVARWRGGGLEAEVGEGAVGLSHLVDVVALAHGRALVVGGVLDFVGESHMHRRAFAVAGVGNKPAHRE